MKLACILVVVAAALTSAEKWQWPESAASVRIDTKVRFIDNDKDTSRKHQKAQDELPFQEAKETEGFYNRPGGSGRYPVRVEPAPGPPGDQNYYSLHRFGKNYNSDGTLDSLQYCKCVSNPDCNPHQDSDRACGAGKFLCCYKKPIHGNKQNTEFFNEIEDERPVLLPGQESLARPFPPPNTGLNGYGYGEVLDETGDRGMLVGPLGPTGNLDVRNRVLVYPDGPKGPAPDRHPGVLVGPGGPTGHIGPANQNPGLPLSSNLKQNPDVLVGPGGPTGVIGPVDVREGPVDPIHPDESAQRGVLVGPGGPSGFIGPQGGYGRRPVLVGPGGPTGIIGPRRPAFGGFYNNGYGRPMGRGVLVGPGGPTGTIGPGRGLLVGPGGPTGVIGPGYFGK